MHRLRLISLAVAAVILGLASAGAATALNGAITSIAPSSGPTTGGTTVTIQGTALWGAFGPTVTIGGALATEISHTGYMGGMEEIVVTTPPGTAGPADVVVSEYGTPSALSSGGFTYVAPGPALTVTGVSPASGLTTGGEQVTITGSGFTAGTTPTVAIGGTAATGVVALSNTSLVATTPVHAVGAADVAVTLDGTSATLTRGYTYALGYWLTVATQRPADIGTLTSPGAIRTPASGSWASTTKTVTGPDTLTTNTGYTGGINCGQRGTRLRDKGLFSSGKMTTETWEAGVCRYAFAAGSTVSLSALGSSDQDNAILSLPWRVQTGFLGAWGGACPASTQGSACSVTMTADRTVRAAWGFFNLGFARILADSTVPVFAADGSMQYFKASAVMVAPPVVAGGTPVYLFYAYLPVAAATSRDTAAARPAGRLACHTAAHVAGRRMTATCTVTPSLARALAAGTVRLTTRWYARLPHQSSPVLIRGGRLTLRNRRASGLTG